MRGQFVLDSGRLHDSDITITAAIHSDDMLHVWITTNKWRVGHASAYLPGLEGSGTIAEVRENNPTLLWNLTDEALADARRTQAAMGMLEMLRA